MAGSIYAWKLDFFDSKKVIAAASAARRKALSRAGALIRKIARRSIKTRKPRADGSYLSSPPGNPPYSHVGTGEFGIKTILFAYDHHSKSVVVGPVGGRGSNVPNVLEYGGNATVWLRPRDRRRLGRTNVKTRIEKRPFMNPALNTAKSEYAAIWKDLIK